ncbi:MAG: NADH-quinone oxidoreductase subunit NuoF [Candidatus Thermoplasmatota archaeon]|nr:NADH-quinone oxidoreductase subunit NuoF [Candidatus Thermoplasmatota archaeon]
MSKTLIRIGYASCGIAAGAKDVLAVVEKRMKKGSRRVELQKTGCIGICFDEPIVQIINEQGQWTYRKVDGKKMERIYDEHVLGGAPIYEWTVGELSTGGEVPDRPIFEHQQRIALRNTGIIDPESLDAYLEKQGYQALEKVLKEMDPDMVVKEIMDSGLRGRGGAGFPTGLKWSFCKKAAGDRKFIICNADEGDPGAFMDRNLLEGDPHSVLEGMMIAANTIGASEGYIYCRAEYPLAIRRLKIAIGQARERGFIGKNIMGTEFSFDITLKEGAGAFVCGEETALIASIEGERGMPRIRPPFPAEAGLWGKPTNNNNVETYANIPWIILNGAREFQKFGIKSSRGTKVFSLAGKINRGGLVEVPMGTPLRKIIFEIGGGIPKDRRFKAVQLGGPSGGCIPTQLLDTPVDYESITATGAIMGSGGMVVMDENTCMVEVARYFLGFTQNESCGKCTFCRIGTLRMLEVLERITKGQGKETDIDELKELAELIRASSLCGLGQGAPNPVLTTLRYFENEYHAHIVDKKCPAGVCKELTTFVIDEEVCRACGLCKKACPSEAIEGKPGVKHVIVQDRCIKCGSCREVCPFDAVGTG